MLPAISTFNRTRRQKFTRIYYFSVKTRGGVSEYILIHLFIETDNQLVALEDRGSPQGTRGPKHQFDEVGHFGFVFFQIVGNDFLAFGGVEEFCLLYQLRGFLFGHLGFASVFLFFDRYAVRVEKLSSLLAARSTLAEIHPVNFPSHKYSFTSVLNPENRGYLQRRIVSSQDFGKNLRQFCLCGKQRGWFG